LINHIRFYGVRLMVKQFLIKLLPFKVEQIARYVLSLFRYTPHYLYDMHRFAKYSINKISPCHNQTQLIARITTLYHVLEKGLTMPEPRLGFGLSRVSALIALLEMYKNMGFSVQNTQYKAGLTSLENYINFHKGTEIDTEFIAIFLVKSNQCNLSNSSFFQIEANDFHSKVKGSFLDLVDIRHSLRDFKEASVPMVDIVEAISIAQKSPSTCNRQSARVYTFSKKNKIQKLLTLQGGARGFQHKIDKLIILTFDIEAYQGEGDRMSGYIDASLFGMTLLYALTQKGIGSISLNWSKSKEIDIQLRTLSNIKKSHNIVFFIGVGMIKDKTKVAASARLDIDEVIVAHNDENYKRGKINK